MNHIPVQASCETSSFLEQRIHVHSSAPLNGTDITPNQDRIGSLHRILVVDDDRDIRQLCVDALIGSGYRVDTAEDAVAGWQLLRANSYDLLLTDNNMPMVSGIELIAKLRSTHMDIPVVLASGAIPTAEIDRNPSLQLATTLLKPFTIDELLDTVENVLRMGDCGKRPGMPSPVLTAQRA